MRIVEAVWEKRNLGVNCTEIIVEESDQVSDIEGLGDVLNSTDYLVIKLPVNRFDLNQCVSKLGFSFIESSMNFQLHLSQAQLSPLQVRLNNAVSYSLMDANDITELNKEISNGLFGTDRILQDENFTKEQAALRYINWIADELAKDTQAYKIVYKDDSIGFFTFKETEQGVYYPFLAGLYKKYETSGLGFTTLRKPIDEALSRGGKMISTYASSNNMPVIRAHTQQGFSIAAMQYVFIKHNK